MKSIKEIIGAEPIFHKDKDAYSPSKASLALMAPEKTNYQDIDYPNADTSGKKKVLVISVDQDILDCKNGKRFITGNHPVELFLVLMHLEKAGFHPVFTTLTGKKVCLEYWAFPHKDEHVIKFKEKHQHQLDNPKKIADVIDELNKDEYQAVYIPGGQGAILGLPESKEVQKALLWFLKNDKFIIVICHGPAGLLSLNIDTPDGAFPLKDYELACFPSSGDNLGAKVGYLPGKMPWAYEKKIKKLGMKVVNRLPVGITHVDRQLISGDSPLAANTLGQLAANTLLQSIQTP